MRIRLSILKLLTVLVFFPGCLSLAALTDSGSGGDESALALLPALGLGSLGGSTGSTTATSEAVTVSGTLTDSDSGLPLSGAEVVFDDGTRSLGAQPTRSITNTSGRWAYEIDVPAGTEVTLSAIIIHGGGQVGRFVIIITVNANDVVFELVSVQGNVRITITVVRPGDNAADVTPPTAPYLNQDGLIGRNSIIVRANGSNFDDVTADEDLIFEFYVKDNQADAEGGPGISPEYVFVGPPTTVFGDHRFELTNLPYGKGLYTKMYVIDEAGNRSKAAAGSHWFITFPEDEYLLFMPTTQGAPGALVESEPKLAVGQNMGAIAIPNARGDAVFGGDTVVNVYGQRSPYGSTWTNRVTLPLGWYPRAITYGEGKFVAVGDSGLRLNYEVNAYSNALINGGPDLNDVAYGGGVFVAVGDDGRRVRSEDGVTWTHDQTANALSRHFVAVAYGDGVFVASGGAYTMRSTDGGQTWTDLVHQGSVGPVAYGNGRFVVSAGRRTLVSTDGGQTWNDPGYDNLDVSYAGKMKFYGGRFVLTQTNGYSSRVAVSTDGVNWNPPGPYGFHLGIDEPAGIVFVDHP